MKLITMRTIGKMRKKRIDEYFSLFANSCKLEIKVVCGIKTLFIKSAAMMYSGIISHHQLITDLSFAFVIEFAIIS